MLVISCTLLAITLSAMAENCIAHFQHVQCNTVIFDLYKKQFFDVVPISATGFLPPENTATTTPTSTTPGISTGAASTTSPLNTGDVGSGKSGQQVCISGL